MSDFVSTNLNKLMILDYKFPNDMELGNSIRKEFGDETYILNLPNDQDLGRKIRKYLENIQK
jgi:hypothetical protein